MEAINLMGGKCYICGYCKNYAAMEFHHLDPSVKESNWSVSRQTKWHKTIEELKNVFFFVLTVIEKHTIQMHH